MQNPNLLKFLVVEDEEDIRNLVVLHLERRGFQVKAVANGLSGKEALLTEKFDLALLDWMLPELSGLELIELTRKEGLNQKTPLIMLTARAEATDIVQGLEAGADDYVTKPFEEDVLFARISALLRRTETKKTPNNSQDIFEVGELKVNPTLHEVWCKTEKLALTLSEFKLLQSLLENRGKVLTRDQLIELVQGDGVNVIGRTIDTHVFGLRKKLGDCSDLVETIRGVGYRIRP